MRPSRTAGAVDSFRVVDNSAPRRPRYGDSEAKKIGLQLAFRDIYHTTSTTEILFTLTLECRNFFNYRSSRRIFELSTAS